MAATLAILEAVEIGVNSDPGPPIQLFNRSGDRLGLSPREWRLLLKTARRFGWSPTRTSHQPEHIDLDQAPDETPWHGDFETPVGQLVAADDARAFVRALHHAVRTWPRQLNGLRPVASQLVKFCPSGFLICQGHSY